MAPSEGRVEKKIQLWKLMDSREAWVYCITTFLAFWITLVLATYFASRYGGDSTVFFYVLAGFFLGFSEVMYWVQKSLKREANIMLNVQGRAE